MTTRRLGVIMNGVTGRMGYRPAPRPIDPGDPRAGRRRCSRRSPGPARTGPGRTQRRQARRDGRQARCRRLDHQPRRGARRRDVPIYFDAQLTSVREQALHAAIAAGKPIYTEKPIASTLAGAIDLRPGGAGRGRTHGVVHDKLFLPGLLKLRRLLDAGFFGRVLSRARRVRLLGLRGRPAARPAAELELPRGGRRRDRHRHVLPLELRPGEPVRQGRGGHRQGRHPHPAARATRRARRTRPPPTTPRTPSSSSTAASSRRSTRRGRSGSTGTNWSSSRSTASTAARSPACDLPRPAPRRNPTRGVEPGPAGRQQLPGRLAGGAGQRPVRQRVQGPVGAVRPARRGDGEPTPYDIAAAARGVQLAEAGLQSSAEGRRIELGEIQL